MAKLFAIRVVAGKEKYIMEKLSTIGRKQGLQIYSVLMHPKMRGYVIVEAENKQQVLQAIFGMGYVKGITSGEIEYKELETLLLKKKEEEIKIEKGDIVEIISGPFKGEKAKVVRVNKLHGEAVVTLLDASVVIPITVKLNSIMLIKREEGEEGS